MITSRFRLLAVLWLAAVSAVLATAAGDLTNAMPYAQGTRKMVLEQLDALLAADKSLQVIGQGSWLRGPAAKTAKLSRSYADPLLGGTSDHDLRLVMQGEDSQLLSKWKSVRDKLAENLRGLFKGKSAAEIEQMLVKNYGYTVEQAGAIARQGGDDVARLVLRSVNLYPPPQVMRTVVNDKTAHALFSRAGAVPSLAGEMIEGVWGEGAPAMIQTFEAQGRLFHVAGGKVRAGFTDLTHLAEGYGKHTMGGYSNMAFQWAEKAGEAAHARDAEAMAKYLSRLKNNLERAKAKGNLSSGVLDDAFKQLDDLIVQAKAGAGVFENPRLAAILKEARLNSKLLGELARNPGPMNRQIIEAILGKSSGRLARFGEAMREVWAKADNWKMFECGLQGAFIAWSVMSVSGTWGEQGMEQALRQAGGDIAFFVGFVPGIMAVMTNMVLDSAKEAGYSLAVSGQEYQDFLAGISAVKGYQGFTGSEKSIEQIADKLASREEVERLIETQAWNIAQLKETGAPQESEATTRSREGIKQALIKKMTPIVLSEWLRVRKERMTRAIDLELELDDAFNQIVFRAETTPVVIEEGKTDGSVELSVQTDTDWGPVENTLTKIAAELQPLGGMKKEVQCDYRAALVWTQGGKRQELSSRRRIGEVFTPQTFRFTEIGAQNLTAEFTLEIILFVSGGASVARDVMDAKPLLVRTYKRTIPIAVDVARVARAKPTPPKSTGMAAPEKVGAGEVFTLRIDKRKFPDFKLGNYKLMLVQPGKKLTFEDAALLQFDPTGGTVKPEGVREIISVVAERPGSDYIEVDAQVRQVEEFAKAESLDLAIVKLDEKGSVAEELKKAQEAMEKAEKDMEEAMAKMTPEQIADMQKKMEEAMEKAERGELPVPKPEDVLPPPPMISVPIVVRPPQIELKIPADWQDDTSLQAWRRWLQRQQGSGAFGDYVYVKAEFYVTLEDGVQDRSNGDMVAGNALELKKNPRAVTTRVEGKGGYKGEVFRTGAASADGGATYGTALLRKGDCLVSVRFSGETRGFRQTHRDEKGNEIVDFDTRAAAQKEYTTVLEQIDRIFASMGIAAKTTGEEPAPRKDAASGPDSDVRLEAAKLECAPGEIVEVACIVDFVKPGDQPYKYEWGGNHAGEGDKVLFLASEPGSYGLGVIVKNAAGKTLGSTSITLKVR